MKKIIALLLALLTVATATVAAFAEAAGDGVAAPTAPVFKGAQMSDDQKSVRFLSTVHSELGDAVGYVIKAIFVDSSAKAQNIAYSKAEGDDYMETDTVYTSVQAAGAEVTLAEIANGDETAVGIAAAVISDIPTTEDVIFEIITYVKEGEAYTYSAASYQKLSNGVLRTLTDDYAEDFSSSVANLYGGKMAWTVANGKLNIPSTAWGNGPFVQLIDRSTFASAPEKYLLEMDLDITKYNNIALMFNGVADSAADTGYKRHGAAVIQFKIDGDAKNTISNLNDGTKRFYIRTGYNYNGTQTIASAYGNPVYTIPAGATSAAFKLSIAVDSTPDNGCDIHLFVNDTYISTRELRGNGYDGDAVYDVSAQSYVSMWAENSIFTIDNMKVSMVEGEITTTLPAAKETLYENGFELSDYGVGKTPEYNAPALRIENGEMISTGGAWKSHSCTIANGATYSDCYAVDFQMDLTTVGTTLLMFNNAGNATTAAGFHKNAFAIRFEWSNSTGFGFYVRKYNSSGGQIGTNVVDADALTTDFAGLDYQSFKLTVIVDSTPDNGCLVTVLANGQYMTAFALDNSYDVKADSTIELWTQETCNVGIDSITVKNYK